MMTAELNQKNKEAVWDFWQKLNHAGVEKLPQTVRAAVHDEVDWNVSAPIDQLLGADNAITGFWAPLFQAFPALKHEPYVFIGGIDESPDLYATVGGEEWVSGCGYLTGHFERDWLGIPATGRKTHIWFGVFYVMREGKIAEAYLQLDVLAVMRQAGFQALPPAPGAEGGKIPGPLAKDGVLLTEQDRMESRKSVQLVQAMGRESDRDPYYGHLYRVGLDGGEPELLTPEDASHTIAFAPGGECFIDNYSTLDNPPVMLLRAADGSLICELERADISALEATGWRAPERFKTKARDGITDIYGALFRPSDLDPDAQYPVIDYIYGGPQAIQAPSTFAEAARDREKNFWEAQSLAELGFAVVMIDGLGMPGRSKAHHDHSYRNLPDNGLPDHIAAIQQLADRYPYLDISRVGIFGHSAGGYASCRAMFAHPDFYKVAVSTAGNHDHRLDKATWVERYMGLPVGEHYLFSANQNHARNLQGKLLLMHGDMDENVHVASTLVVVDALIKANKDFDLLIMPNQPHSCTAHPYFVRRRWDYFLRHLLGVDPPAGYEISE